MKKESIKKLSGVTLFPCLAKWYISKGRDPFTVPECFVGLAGFENNHGSFIITRHQPFYIPIRTSEGQIVDYGYVPKDAWCGQVFSSGELIHKKTKRHKRWSNQLR